MERMEALFKLCVGGGRCSNSPELWVRGEEGISPSITPLSLMVRTPPPPGSSRAFSLSNTYTEGLCVRGGGGGGMYNV